MAVFPPNRPVDGMKRSYLFLQGCTSPFFTRLGDLLRSRGHRVWRINFNAGDAAYWGQRPAWRFRGTVAELPGFLQGKVQESGCTDIIMLGDTRPIHRPVPELAKRLGIRVHVFEEGYFRPGWLTLERDGINGNSRLPREAAWYRRVGPRIPDPGPVEQVHNPLRLLALHEALYHLPNLANPLWYPGYRTHRPHVSAIEFLGWGRRFSTLYYHEKRDHQTIMDLVARDATFFVLPLQLDSDSQIRTHSPFDGMGQVLETVVSSYARHAPGQSQLVIKNHPLDTGFVNYRRIIREMESRFDLKGRLIYLETGHLPTLLGQACGVVTVNSTVGTSALHHHCATKVLAKAVFDMEGLTFQGPLDDFWCRGDPADPQLLAFFRKAVIHLAQVNGGFYSRRGIELGIANSLRFLEADRSPMEAFGACV